MSHMIRETKDATTERVFYHVAVAQDEGESWHALEQKAPTAMLVHAGAKLARVDGECRIVPAFYEATPGFMQKAPDSIRVVLNDQGVPISSCGADYVPLCKATIFNALDKALSGKPLVSTIGELDEGRRAWVQTVPFNRFEPVAGDPVEERLTLVWSYDESITMRWFLSFTRVVCHNTLTASISDSKRRKGPREHVEIRATKNGNVKVQETGETLALLSQHGQSLREAFTRLAAKKVTREYVQDFLLHMFPSDPDSKRSESVAQNKRVDVLALTANGIGMGRIAGTRWALFNAVTQWIDRERSVQGSTDRLVSSRLGEATPRKLRQHALNLLLPDTLPVLDEADFALN